MRSVTKLKDTVTVVCYVVGHSLSISSKIWGTCRSTRGFLEGIAYGIVGETGAFAKHYGVRED